MKKLGVLILCSLFAVKGHSQGKHPQIDSLFFHLYTDSLKKGTHNYINVDGKTAAGNWLPLSDKEVLFSASSGKFEGNDLVVPADFREQKITVTASLRSRPEQVITRDIWIKQRPDPDLPPYRRG